MKSTPYCECEKPEPGMVSAISGMAAQYVDGCKLCGLPLPKNILSSSGEKLEENGCCLNCYHGYGEMVKENPDLKRFSRCRSDLSCECHSPKKDLVGEEHWIDRFNSQFLAENHGWNGHINPLTIKDFIRETRTEAVAQERERILKIIKDLRATKSSGYILDELSRRIEEQN